MPRKGSKHKYQGDPRFIFGAAKAGQKMQEKAGISRKPSSLPRSLEDLKNKLDFVRDTTTLAPELDEQSDDATIVK